MSSKWTDPGEDRLMAFAQPSLADGLSVNLFEVELSDSHVPLWGLPFSLTQFDEFLQDKNLRDFFFYRFDKTLYAWERRSTERELPAGFQKETVTIDEHAPIFRKVVEEAIVEYFVRQGYEIHHIKFSSNWEVSLRKEPPQRFDDLSLTPTLVFSVTNLYSTKSEKQIISLAVSKRYVPRFTSAEEDLNRKHIDTRDWDRNFSGQLAASPKNLRLYLEATNQTSRYFGFLRIVESGKRHFEYLKETCATFNGISSALLLPAPLRITNFRFSSLPNSSFEGSIINKPQYYFHNENTRAGDYYDRVLTDLKPYSFDLFANRNIRIVVITPEAYEGTVDEYIVKLRQILERTFHLNKLNFDIVTVKARQRYSSALEEFDPVAYDLALVIVSEQQKKIPIKQSPYFVLKARLLNQRLPSQDLTIEVIRKNNVFINKNIALNIYSKLGGTAWTIEKIEKNVSEFIVGIGSTTDEEKNLIIGFANIFEYNGTYILGDCSQFTTKATYVRQLSNYLRKQLEVAIRTKNIGEGESIRLVFHIFKAAAEEYEINAIEQTLSQFQSYSIKYALVHLSYNHNYRVFRKEGEDQPRRGTFIQLATYQALLHLGGRSVVPVLVRLDKRSTYKDIYAITKQALFFSHLSHRTFLPPSKPVTIKYPSLMAKLVSELKQVSGWDVAVLNNISEKLWFI